MTGINKEENDMKRSETAPDRTPELTTDTKEQSPAALLFGVQPRMSDAYDSESLTRFLSGFTESDLRRQSERLSSLYDEPEEASATEDGESTAGIPEAEEPVVVEAAAESPEIEEPVIEDTSDETPITEEPVVVEPADEGPAAENSETPGSMGSEVTAALKAEKSEDSEEAVEAEKSTGSDGSEEARKPEEPEEPFPELPEEPDFTLAEGQPVSWYRMIPIALSAAVIPLIVQLKIYTLPLGGLFWSVLADDSPIYDYYSWYKMLAVLGTAALCVILLAIDVVRKKQRFKLSFAYIPATAFAVTAVASYAANGFKEFTLLGWPGRMEGTLTLVAYMIILCYTVLTINTARSARAAAGAFCVSLAVFTVIGLLQYLGLDPFAADTAVKLTGAFEGLAEAMPGLTSQDAVHQTFGDPSASAMHLCLGIPVAAMIYAGADYRGKWIRWFKSPLIFMLIALCFVNAVAVKTALPLLGLAAAFIVGTIVFHRNLKYWTKPILLMIVAAALILTVCFRTWMPVLERAFPSIFPAEETAEDQRPGLNSVTTGEDSVTFRLKGSNAILKLKVETENTSIIRVLPMDGTDHILNVSETEEPGIYQIEEEPYHSAFKLCIIKRNNALALRVSMPQKDWDFVAEDGEIRFVNECGRTVRLYEPEHSGLISDPGYADCAAAVWDSALPMLKNTVLIGRGADSFCLYYPHMDYARAYTAGLDEAPSAEGPKSALINTAFGTGWISAAALASIYLVYIVQSVIIFWRRKLSHPLSYAGAGIFLGTIGFLAAALVSDTSVCTMPPFLTLLGTGIAINRILKGGK